MRAGSPPRLDAFRDRARCTRICRIERAAIARKCVRFCQLCDLSEMSLTYASCTRAVACRVCPGLSRRRYDAAIFRSSL